MPAKNVVKEFYPDAYYHIYNRGVAKQTIFIDEQDYKSFLSYLKIYLSSIDKSIKVSPSRKLKNYFQKLRLLAYCLMPNHFHLFIWQENKNSISEFMQSILTKYSMYFNKKYKRIGPVFQGKYKAVRIVSENQFTYLSKYLHRNPFQILPTGSDLEGYKYSSYQNYLRKFSQSWLDINEILNYFSKTKTFNSYKNFVEEIDETDLLRIKNLVLDLDF
ncbi:MAG: transposase [Candidatus Beckwithbacteria bacterium]